MGGFNWAGGAAGASDYLAEAIRNRMLEQEMAIKQQQLAESSEYRRTQQEIARQNAESLADTRQARVDEKNRAAGREKQMVDWAKSVTERQGPDQAGDWQTALDRARAQNILATGEDLPPGMISQIMASYMRQPKEDTHLRSPEALQQEKELIITREKAQRDYARPPAPRGGSKQDDWDERRYGPAKLPSRVQAYIMNLRSKHADEESAVEEFSRNIGGVMAGNPYLDTTLAINQIRALFGKKKTPTVKIQQGE